MRFQVIAGGVRYAPLYDTFAEALEAAARIKAFTAFPPVGIRSVA